MQYPAVSNCPKVAPATLASGCSPGIRPTSTTRTSSRARCTKSAPAASSHRAGNSTTSAPISRRRRPGAPSDAGAPTFGVRGQVGALNSTDALLGAQIKQNDWNQFQVIARGNVLIHVLNGHVTALFVDDDPVARAMEAAWGLQVHSGATHEG